MKEENKFLAFLASTAGKWLITAVCVVLIFGILIVGLQSDSMVVLGITLFACAYFGWRALNSITPDIFLFMSIGGWAIYFLIKGLLSIIVGVFVAPFQIGIMISGYVNEIINTK